MAARSAVIVRSGLCRTSAKPRPNPSLFYFPGLTTTPVHDRSQFEWVPALESAADAIRDEYLALRKALPASDYATKPGERTLHHGQWDWNSYIMKGRRQRAFQDACPTTAAILDSVPGLMDSLPLDYAFFSTLRPGSRIAPHYGPHNLRIRCHLPLIVPPGCFIRVAGKEQTWTEGRCFLFDDTYEHEVWHTGESQQDRVVLLFDVWHPELEREEREEIMAMFAQMNTSA